MKRCIMFVSNSASISHILPSLSFYSNSPASGCWLELHLLFLISSISACMMNGIRNFNHVAKSYVSWIPKEVNMRNFPVLLSRKRLERYLWTLQKRILMLFGSRDEKEERKKLSELNRIFGSSHVEMFKREKCSRMILRKMSHSHFPTFLRFFFC